MITIKAYQRGQEVWYEGTSNYSVGVLVIGQEVTLNGLGVGLISLLSITHAHMLLHVL